MDRGRPVHDAVEAMWDGIYSLEGFSEHFIEDTPVVGFFLDGQMLLQRLMEARRIFDQCLARPIEISSLIPYITLHFLALTNREMPNSRQDF